jgi:hypothetical protein
MISSTYLYLLPLNLFSAILTYVQIGKTEFHIQTFWHPYKNATIDGTLMNIPEKISTHSFIPAFLCWSNESINFLKPPIILQYVVTKLWPVHWYNPIFLSLSWPRYSYTSEHLNIGHTECAIQMFWVHIFLSVAMGW